MYIRLFIGIEMHCALKLLQYYMLANFYVVGCFTSCNVVIIHVLFEFETDDEHTYIT